MIPKKITAKYDESYVVSTFKPEEENTHCSGGKKEHRDNEEDEDDEMNGRQRVGCSQQ